MRQTTDHVVAYRDTGDRRPDAGHDAGHLVTQDRRHGIPHVDRRDGVVGLTEPDRLDVDEHLSPNRRRNGDVLDAESAANGVHNRGFHRVPFRPLRPRVAAPSATPLRWA